MLRVILDSSRDPRLNMALDEALARLARTPVLRVYSWLPPAVTIGRSQDFPAAVRLGETRRRGVVVVRRPTGGGALFHSSLWEVTYSVALPRSHSAVEGLDVASSSALLARGVAEALRSLGLNASVRGMPGGGSAALCLERAGSSDVLVSGKKVSGSAQARLGGAILQHGVILLRLDPRAWASLIRGAEPQAVARVAAGILDLGVSASWADVADALVYGFSGLLGEEPRESGLSGEEVFLASRLLESKYSRPGWSAPPWPSWL